MLRPDLVDKLESIARDWSKDDESDDIEEILNDSFWKSRPADAQSDSRNWNRLPLEL